MSWAREIYEELQREEGSEVSEDCEWHECEEWCCEDYEFGEREAGEQQRHGRSVCERDTLREGWGDAVVLTDRSIFEPSALDSTRGGLTVPVQRTGVSIEAKNAAEAGCECFLCGEHGCDCAGSRPWQEVWCVAAAAVCWAVRMREKQRVVTQISVGLKALARSRSGEEKRRKKQRECDERWFQQRWIDLWWMSMDLMEKEEWIVQLKLIGIVQKAAIQTAMRHQVEVREAENERQLQQREAAFRRIVMAEQKAKTSRAERRQEGKSQMVVTTGKKNNQKRQTDAQMSEVKLLGDMRAKGTECEKKNPLRYEKQANVIRSREPKVPW